MIYYPEDFGGSLDTETKGGIIQTLSLYGYITVTKLQLRIYNKHEGSMN